MKNKLLFAALLVATSTNGMEEDQGMGPAAIYTEAEIHNSLENRVDQLNDYYKNNMEEYFDILDDLECVFDENIRKSFFRDLVSENNCISYDEAMLTFIRSAAQTIIASDPYQQYSNYVSYEKDSPEYQRAIFFFSLVEGLDPVTRHYMAQVEALKADNALGSQ